MYYFLFFICIISRLLTSIYYIEDIDSLRFALSVVDGYDVSKYQPHFPGYPVFCLLVILLYKITNSIAFSFSIIGGLSTFILIYFSIKIFNFKEVTKETLFLILIIFFNPMIWLFGNRYMPDLMGMSISIASFYYMLFSKEVVERYIGLLLAGILLGIRLSYFPLLIIPLCYLFFNKNRQLKYFISFICGIMLWLIPFIYVEGFFNLLKIGSDHFLGHFNNYGGTVLTDNNLLIRIKYLIHTIWADGLGGYWVGRSWTSIFLSIPIYFLLFNFTNIKRNIFNNKTIIIISSVLLYLIWIFFFQNIIYKSRHVLPLVYFILLFICTFLRTNNQNIVKYSYIFILFVLTLNLLIAHKGGTAISHLSINLNDSKPDIILSNNLVNYYLKSNGLKSNYIDIEKISIKDIENLNIKDLRINIIGNYSDLFLDNKFIVSIDTIFYHNPYMNRMWSEIPLYSLELNNAR